MSNDLCKKCRKPLLASHAGSVTSYFFQHNYCQCHMQANSGSTNPVCSQCGKSKPTDQRIGSFTSFLFRELRCQCSGAPVVVKDSIASGVKKKIKRATTHYRAAQKTQFTKSIRKNDSQASASEVTSELAPGTIVGGVFRVESTIGLGGMGVVYIAQHIALGRHFALKVLRPEFVNEQLWLRFQAEAKTLAALNHVTFVNVYDLGIHEKSLPFYSMDLVEGRNLEQILSEFGPCELNRALEIFIKVLDGLAYAHRNGIIHRDIKPANIMLIQGPGRKAPEVKILDFGISKLVGGHSRELQNLTSSGEVFGSPYYMSPEQCMGTAVDARSDIYSIGCSLFEVLTGYVPFEGDNSVEIIDMHEDAQPPTLADVMPDNDFPPSIELVIAKCLAKLPKDRYQSAKQLAIDLTRILEGKDISLYTAASTKADDAKPQISKAQSRTTIYAVAAVSVLVVVASIIAALVVSPLMKGGVKPTAKIVSLHEDNIRDINIKEGNTKGSTDKAKRDLSNPEATLNDIGSIMVSETPSRSEEKLVAEPASALGTTPYSTIKVINGVKYRCFKFPTDLQIGLLSFSQNGRSTTIPAMNEVKIPIETKVTFISSVGILENPIYWKRFRAGDMYALYLLDTSLDDREFAQQLEASANIGGIQSLHLGGASLLASAVPSLSKFKSLTEFTAQGSKNNIAILSKATCWSKIEKFIWHETRGGAPTEILKMLQGSHSLKELSFYNAALSQSDCELIGSMTSLEALSLQEMPMPLACLEKLSQTSKIKRLRLPLGCITKTSVPILARFQSLVELAGEVNGSHTKLDAILKKDLPKVKCFIFYPEPKTPNYMSQSQVTE
ncbi:hypothetical protein BH11CYA1_BH11CYA1_03570 [soil metagenome]